MKRAKKYHPNHPHIDGRNVVIGSDYDALAAKAERYIQEGISLADQRDALAADNQRLREDRDSHQRACMAQIEKAARLLAALEFACKSLAQVTSSDGSGHADIALSCLRMAGVDADEREQMVDGWTAKCQWRIHAALAGSKESN